MGGLHSGRKRKHTCINDCLTIDTTRLRKDGLFALTAATDFAIGWTFTRHTDFVKEKKQEHKMAAHYAPGDSPSLTLSWRSEAKYPDGRRVNTDHRQAIALVTTPCQYGGSRWWFICPTCCQRVRILYLPTKCAELERLTIQCRSCSDLHYASQVASYIERHKTYERHLLANYGLAWAAWRYDYELKEHYLEMTPELWALRQKSVLDWNIHLLKAVIRCDLVMLRSDLANLRSLRSEEDRRMYLEHMSRKERELHTRELVNLLHESIQKERLIYKVNTAAMPDDLFTTYASLADMGEEMRQKRPAQSGQAIENAEQKIISLEKLLKEVNKREKKAA